MADIGAAQGSEQNNPDERARHHEADCRNVFFPSCPKQPATLPREYFRGCLEIKYPKDKLTVMLRRPVPAKQRKRCRRLRLSILIVDIQRQM